MGGGVGSVCLSKFFLISCLANVDKRFGVLSLVQQFFVIKKVQTFFFSFNVLVGTSKYFYCHCIYNCIKNINILCWLYKKNHCFLSFCSTIFYSKIANVTEYFSRGVVKWPGYEQRKGIKNLKFQANKLFEFSLW